MVNDGINDEGKTQMYKKCEEVRKNIESLGHTVTVKQCDVNEQV